MLVRRGSQVHQMPQVARAQSMPVSRQMLEYTTVTSAVAREERGCEVDVRKDQTQHRNGNVIVEDASDVALGRIGGDEEDGLAEAESEHSDADPEPEPGDIAEGGGALLHRSSLSRMRSFGVENGLEEQNADRGEDDVVAEELFDPGADLYRVQIGGQDAGGGLDHGQESWEGDWQ